MTPPNVLPLVVAFLAGLALVPLSIRLAHRLGLVVRPRGDRWGARAIPMFGGLGVTGGILLGIAVGVAVGALAPVDGLVVAAGMLALFILGFADDRGEVSPRLRLALEAGVGAAMAFVVTDGQGLPLQVVATVLALVAVPLAVNATNLVDNADGLAASLSTVTALTLSAAPLVLRLDGAGDVPLAIAGATLAFLVFNRPPARTFMGDAGSLPLGGALAGGSLLLVDAALAVSAQATVAAVCIVALAWTAQLADMALVVTSRVRRGRSPFQGGTDHTSHRLFRMGLGGAGMLGVVIVGAGLAGVVGLVAGAIATGEPLLGVVIAVLAIAVALTLELSLARRQPALADHDPLGDQPATSATPAAAPTAGATAGDGRAPRAAGAFEGAAVDPDNLASGKALGARR